MKLIIAILALFLASATSAQVQIPEQVASSSQTMNAWHVDYIGIHPEGRHIKGLNTAPSGRLFLQSLKVLFAGTDSTDYSAIPNASTNQWIDVSTEEMTAMMQWYCINAQGDTVTAYAMLRDIVWRGAIQPQLGLHDSTMTWTQVMFPKEAP